MEKRWVLLLRLVVGLILIGGLLGLWIATYQETFAMRVVPEAVSMPAGPVALTLQQQIRLYAGPTMASPVAYTIEGDNVWVGANTTNQPVYTLQGDRLMRSFSNEIQYTFSGNHVYRGPDTNTDAVYMLVEHRVFQGDSATGQPLLTYVGHRAYWGAGPTGSTMLTANVDLEGNPTLELLIPILLLERFE